MAATIFAKKIDELNFSFLSKEGQSGVLFTRELESTKLPIHSPDILFALETANRFEADAVYFRFFDDGRAAVPQLYFFDYTRKNLTDDARNSIHVRMWNGYQVPAYIIIEKTSVSIFDSREKPQSDKSNYAREIIKLSGDAISSFNAQDFDDGLFWAGHSDHFQFEESATRDLIRGLKALYKAFQEKSGLDKHVALKLLVQSMLIKYLEERDEDSASGYFAGTYFKRNFQCENFCDTIRKGKILELFDQLAKDFNGKIFEWDVETEHEEREAIQQSEVSKLADYLDGNSVNSQYVIWRLYSFSHLPVEVISSVYEELLTDSKDIVYTPEMIVSTLVDECMPLRKPQKDFKLIDVSCGSGIFLVKAYKRIVQWWRYENWLKTGELVKPSLAVLKDLLLKSIHGIDIQQDAIRLSIFSLALAILDEVNLDPPTWGKLKFPDLSSNIITENFFKYITADIQGDFDLVIGNPPFNLQSVGGKEPSRKKYFKDLKEKFGYESEIRIPDENPALHFLVKSMRLLKSGALLCMIQPSGPLFYQNDPVFKKKVFVNSNLLQVIDLTKLADKLWGKTNVATAAVFLQKCPPDSAAVLHLVANRTFSNSNRLFLEFDYYDFHMIDKDATYSNPYIWKANLLGGGRILQLLERLTSLPTLGTFLKYKRKNNNWVFGDGFIKGKPDEELVPADFERKKGGYREFPYLDNSTCIVTRSFTEEGIGETYPLKGKFYQWGRTPELFEPPLLLIKKVLGKRQIPTHLSVKPISFRDQIIGIHAPSSEISELLAIQKYFSDNADLVRFYILATSAQVLVNRASAIFSEDILNLPYITDDSQHLLSDAEQLVLKDALFYYLSSFGKEILEDAKISVLKSFASAFSKTLNSVYQSTGTSFKLYKILDSGNYYALHFEYTKEATRPIIERADDLEDYIDKIVPKDTRSVQGNYIRRIVKVYGKDSIILIKPKHKRYWLSSIALRDADDSFTDYVKTRLYNA